MITLAFDWDLYDMRSQLTETDDLIALFDEVLHCSLVSATAIGRTLIEESHTDTAGIKTAGVREANLYDELLEKVQRVAV